MRATQTVVAREAIIALCTGNKKTVQATRVDEQMTVRSAQADKEKTKKISSPQPSPWERECSNGKVRQKMNEQKTVRVAQEDKQ